MVGPPWALEGLAERGESIAPAAAAGACHPGSKGIFATKGAANCHQIRRLDPFTLVGMASWSTPLAWPVVRLPPWELASTPSDLAGAALLVCGCNWRLRSDHGDAEARDATALERPPALEVEALAWRPHSGSWAVPEERC